MRGDTGRAPGRLMNFVARCVRFVWKRSPERWQKSWPYVAVGKFVYHHVTRYDMREQSHSTWFLRSIPQIEVWRDLVLKTRPDPQHPLRIASVACSTGAELYTTLYVIRSSHPELKIEATGADLSPGVVEIARDGLYDPHKATSKDRGTYHPGAWELTYLAEEARRELFDEAGDGRLRIKDWIRAGSRWITGDATDPEVVERLGPQDVVLAKNFLGPMDDDMAESCVRNIIQLVRPGGYLVVDGMDLDLRANLFPTIGLIPVLDRMEEIYHDDPTKLDWPWHRWAHEPLDQKQANWAFRYCSIFRKPDPAAATTLHTATPGVDRESELGNPVPEPTQERLAQKSRA